MRENGSMSEDGSMVDGWGDCLDNVCDRGRFRDNSVETVDRVGRIINGASAAIRLYQRVL